MRFYAVVRGRVPGIYTQWEQCRDQVQHYPNALYKRFNDEATAKQWILASRTSSSSPPDQGVQATSTPSYSLPTPPLPSTSGSPAFDDEIIRKQYNIPDDAVMIYTDGACPSNGLIAGRAGIGVFFGLDDPRNISSRLPGHHQTNQRAELFAVLKALEVLHTGVQRPNRVVILTDSKYVVQALTEWVPLWEKKGWTTANKTEVVSQDLFKRARDMLTTLAANGTVVEFRHVRGHTGLWGNEQADRLAVQGAWMDTVVQSDWDELFDDEDLDDMIAEMENV